MSPQRHHARHAFTMIELVLVIAIISILAAVAIPRFSSAMVRQRADAAARRVATDLKFARHRARATSSAVTVTFDNATNTYGINGLPDMDHPDSFYSVTLSDDPYGATFVFAASSGDSSVTFDGYGVADSDCTVLITVGDETRSVALDAASGKITITEALAIVGTGEIGVVK